MYLVRSSNPLTSALKPVCLNLRQYSQVISRVVITIEFNAATLYQDTLSVSTLTSKIHFMSSSISIYCDIIRVSYCWKRFTLLNKTASLGAQRDYKMYLILFIYWSKQTEETKVSISKYWQSKLLHLCPVKSEQIYVLNHNKAALWAAIILFQIRVWNVQEIDTFTYV